ncbi:GMC oxidoreductase [Streptomyces chrestomyceticus]|uniref:GMC oxidoreductase n=1 Tax=Streptomyces chrestomyceticus TaxID=68185 RepID=UPI001F49E22D|nr:GMC oxidoreductase [Streptomyces chrestomyceticus]
MDAFVRALLHAYGTGPRDSVPDADCRSRAIDRLYVADNSALANSLGSPNPTPTTQALAPPPPTAPSGRSPAAAPGPVPAPP